ncbi:MAG: Bax inhibitor-1/YccA family protein [Ktedonobacteraceae bacterium]
MFNLGNNSPFGGQRNNRFGSSKYQYQTMAPNMAGAQASGLVSKVMALLATSFLVATVGAFIGMNILGLGGYFVVIIAGFITLLILYAVINVQGWNLFLLFLFIFLEGLGLGPLVGAYLGTGNGYILGEAFLITAITAFSLAIYSWTTKRNFARLGDYLFVGMILLLVTSIIGIFFQSAVFSLIIAFFGVAIFCGYILYYVQRAKYMADTLPNAIGLTVSLFLTLMNLFLYILEILTIFQGGGGRRR